MADKPSLTPMTWNPPRDTGLTGHFAPTASAADVEVWAVPGTGPEDVAVDDQGRVYTGTREGQILRVSSEGAVIERIADTGGRPLGIEVDADGTLVVCDAHRGLLRVDPASGAVTVLVDASGPAQLTFTNNCDIASDGSIYFTDTSNKFPVEYFKGDLLEGTPRGRLLRWSPDGTCDIITRGLRFANGVGLAADDSYALVNETAGYRVARVWLSGDKAGMSEVVLDNIPGMPDNLSAGSNGIFWAAIPSERNALLDRLLPMAGALRKAVWALPDSLQPEANRVVLILGFDGDGTVRHVVHAPGDRYHYVTGVREHEGWLYLGSLVEGGIARVPVPQ